MKTLLIACLLATLALADPCPRVFDQEGFNGVYFDVCGSNPRLPTSGRSVRAPTGDEDAGSQIIWLLFEYAFSVM